MPLVAKWITELKEIPAEEKLFADFVPQPPAAVWCDDKPFGNLKTTWGLADLEAGRSRLITRLRNLPFHRRLSDVPSGMASWVIGSSGMPGGNRTDGNRFLEIVVGNGNAARELDLRAGSSLLSESY